MEKAPLNKCLFLFQELAGYTVACLKKLASDFPAEVHVFRYPVNQVAPFHFSLEDKNLFIYDRPGYTDEELEKKIESIRPDLILAGGWSDKGYMRICKKYKNSIPVILGFDNPWRGTPKQYAASLIGPLFIHKYFNECWVAGQPQRVFARKLGFRNEKIKDDVYSCDYDYFHMLYQRFRDAKKSAFPKRIIFVGRYTKLKGASELWKAFVNFQEQSPNEWELWCLGKGDLEHEFPVHDKIRNLGFILPENMGPVIEGTGVFILPSHYEHWGVVVHEFAAAGFPLICSTTTSAATAFLKDGYNGFLHEPCNVNALENIFHKISNTPTHILAEMGDRSAAMAASITPEKWSRNVMSYFKDVEKKPVA